MVVPWAGGGGRCAERRRRGLPIRRSATAGEPLLDSLKNKSHKYLFVDRLLVESEVVRMTIHYRGGSIFTSTAQTLVVPVNCRGVAGCGLALQFRERYLNWYQAYRQCCNAGELRIGRPLLHWGDEPWILSFPTKDDWRLPSELACIEAGLAVTVLLCARHGIESIAFPKLGTGAGRLSWQEVHPLMEAYLSAMECDVFIYM